MVILRSPAGTDCAAVAAERFQAQAEARTAPFTTAPRREAAHYNSKAQKETTDYYRVTRMHKGEKDIIY